MFETLTEAYGEPAVGIAGGLLIGALFGAAAQISRFCLRSGAIELARNGPGERFAVWLLGLGAAMLGVQLLAMTGFVTLDQVRALAGGGSLSGAIIGGVAFGVGMVLARGCVSRLLVLSASGNLRAVATTVIFVAVALATMRGPLTGAREAVASLAPLQGANHLSLLKAFGLTNAAGAALGGALLALAVVFARRARLSAMNGAGGVLVGLAVAAAFLVTSGLNAVSFDPQPVQGLSFIAPYANSAAMALGLTALRPDFTLALVPGVAFGALAAALIRREFRIETFRSGTSALRYGAGAVLMGFGGVVAAGCSLGNGVSNLAALSTTALAALAAMVLGAMATDAALDRQPSPSAKLVAAE